MRISQLVITVLLFGATSVFASTPHIIERRANEAQPQFRKLENIKPEEHIYIDTLMLVEPKVYEIWGREYVNTILKKQIANVNRVFEPHGITHKGKIIEWIDNRVHEHPKSESWGKVVGDVIYSCGYTKEEFDQEFNESSHYWDYQIEATELTDIYQTDTVVYVTTYGLDDGTAGQAFMVNGNVLAFDNLINGPWIFAHERGHNFMIGGHHQGSLCDERYLMCEWVLYGDEQTLLTKDEINNVDRILGGDITVWPEHFHDVFDFRFWGGLLNEPMPISANVKLTLKDSPVPAEISQTELEIELVNDDGEPQPVYQVTELNLYTQADSAKNGEHYQDAINQRITFLAGQSKVRVDLDVNHDFELRSFKVGTDTGLYLDDASPLDVILDADKTVQPPVEPPVTPQPSSDGGSLSIISLICCGLFGCFRRYLVHRFDK